MRLRNLAFSGILAGFLLANLLSAGTLTSDNFDRPAGGVGNGWSTYGGGADIFNNQLRTYGATYAGGGIGRSLTVTFPITISFDFRTDEPADGSWEMGFNTADYYHGAPAEVYLSNGYHGSMGLYMSGGGATSITGTYKDYGSQWAHISGIINADFSAVVSVQYSDGSYATTSFAAPAVAPAPQGGYFYLGNTNAPYGPHYFDNLEINSVPEPATVLLGLSGTLALLGVRRFRRKPKLS